MAKFYSRAPFDAHDTGKVRFDDLGNASYHWQDELLKLDGPMGDKLRQRALHNPTLALVDDEPSDDPRAPNYRGARLGYNPYNSGQLVEQPHKKRVDLRELSKWIERQKQLKPNGKY